jgi:uncharacterized protein YecE (DUF72 family)
MRYWVGTSGYSYKEWKGSFYPEKIAAKDMLAYYGTRLPAVEINNTFYRMPNASVLESWAEQVPPEFRFALKASRKITHFGRLKNVADETAYLLKTASTLGERLGVVLFQLPPNFPKDVDRLRAFLAELPRAMRAAFEFRHASWSDDEVHDALREHGSALCLSDQDDQDEPAFVSTAEWGYLRLRRVEYSDETLATWHARVRDSGWHDAFVFFKHEDEGTGPKLAARFLETVNA